MNTHDKALWRSIALSRYDFGAVGAALFSLFGLVASGVASAHVVATLFATTKVDGSTPYDAITYGVAVFLLAEGVAYYIEVYALFETKLRWWLWLLRWVGPLLSACAGGLAAYSWLPDAYKWLAAITTLVLPLFQWGFLSILMDRIRAVHARRMVEATQPVEPSAAEQLVAIYQQVQHQRALDDLAWLQEAMQAERERRLIVAARSAPYPTPVAVEATDVATEENDVATGVACEPTNVAIEPTGVATTKVEHDCPTCGVARSPQAYALARRYDPEQARCTACRKAS